MKRIERVAIIGLGAIGAAYGSYINRLESVTLEIIVDEERAARYQNRQYTINGEGVPFRFVSGNDQAVPADLILVAVKHHDLEEAIKLMKPFVGAETVILSLMNGISSEEAIGAVYGMEKVLYGICVGVDAQRQEGNISFSTIGKITFGKADNKVVSPEVEAIKALFTEAQIPFEVPEDMLKSLWWKFMVNVGVNQTSALLRAPYGVFQQAEEARELLAMAMEEVIALANARGIRLTSADIQSFYQVLATLSPEGKTSMLQDVEAGRKTEVDMLAGEVIKQGALYQVPTPVNRLLLKAIQVIEKNF